MIIIFLKKTLKNLLFKLNLKIEKIYIQNEYNLEPPSKELTKYMSQSSGILHIGAHRGSEAPIYEWFGKKVIWIEANPKIFLDLKINIKPYKFQRAICGLLTDKENTLKKFYISNNDAASSSIYKFGSLSCGEESLWKNKNLNMIDEIKLKTKTLDKLIDENNIEIENYDHWVIDVQGAELAVLQGSKKKIQFCNSLYIEVSQGDVYRNGSQWIEVKKFLKSKGLSAISNIKSEHENVLFIRK